jgi:hypothetical protein
MKNPARLLTFVVVAIAVTGAAAAPIVVLEPESSWKEVSRPCDCCTKGQGGPWSSTGCDCWHCEDIVCYFDPYCCNVNWDNLCDSAALEMCTCCRLMDPGHCPAEPGDDGGADDGGADVPATTGVGGSLMVWFVLAGSAYLLRRRVAPREDIAGKLRHGSRSHSSAARTASWSGSASAARSM